MTWLKWEEADAALVRVESNLYRARKQNDKVTRFYFVVRTPLSDLINTVRDLKWREWDAQKP